MHVTFVAFYFYLPTLGAVLGTILFHPPLQFLPPHQRWILTQLLHGLNPPLPVPLLPDQFYLGVDSYPHLASEGVAPLLQFLLGEAGAPQVEPLVLGLAWIVPCYQFSLIGFDKYLLDLWPYFAYSLHTFLYFSG